MEDSSLFNSNAPALTLANIGLKFGGITALKEVSCEFEKGSISAIIGPNGAGKTCVINCVSGFYHPDQGEIRFEENPITHLSPQQIAKKRIARTFQNIALFNGMTVLDNMMSGRHIHMRSGIVSSSLYFGPAQKEEIKHRHVVEEIIGFLEMQSIRNKIVGSLPYGLRKRVELGRAMTMEPRLLLLDEPMAGMNVEEKEDMARFILDIQEERGLTIMLVEHDMGVVMDIADKIVVLDFGVLISQGSPEKVKADPKVIRAYLGEEMI